MAAATREAGRAEDRPQAPAPERPKGPSAWAMAPGMFWSTLYRATGVASGARAAVTASVLGGGASSSESRARKSSSTDRHPAPSTCSSTVDDDRELSSSLSSPSDSDGLEAAPRSKAPLEPSEEEEEEEEEEVSAEASESAVTGRERAESQSTGPDALSEPPSRIVALRWDEELGRWLPCRFPELERELEFGKDTASEADDASSAALEMPAAEPKAEEASVAPPPPGALTATAPALPPVRRPSDAATTSPGAQAAKAAALRRQSAVSALALARLRAQGAWDAAQAYQWYSEDAYSYQYMGGGSECYQDSTYAADRGYQNLHATDVYHGPSGMEDDQGEWDSYGWWQTQQYFETGNDIEGCWRTRLSAQATPYTPSRPW
eukprot:TRINITY_DN4047_c0_g1_i1.p1 TRINITY_DN4047_c0_g1~~TRINITY_DN4047_c0_g1_i1.p1  ORF type:complete len:378 (+),score=82.44 TRINITY_DN4047_c0_g1_i1:80-1213(+)